MEWLEGMNHAADYSRSVSNQAGLSPKTRWNVRDFRLRPARFQLERLYIEENLTEPISHEEGVWAVQTPTKKAAWSCLSVFLGQLKRRPMSLLRVALGNTKQ